jgi:hypothetical protein
MIVQNKIFLRKKRDFGDMFGTIFTLLRRNFSVLFGSLVLVAGPFILLTAVLSAMMQSTIFSTVKDMAYYIRQGNITQVLSDMLTESLPWFVLIYLAGLLSFSFIRTTVANFFVIYESKMEGEHFTINEVARKTYRDVWSVLGGMIVFALVSFIPLLIILLPFILLMSVGGIGGVMIGIMLLFLCMIAFGPQLTYIFQFAMPFVMVRDKVFVFSAIGRIFKNLKGNFWWTWVLMVCIFLVVMVLVFVTNIPVMVYQQMANVPGAFSRNSIDDMVDMYSSPTYLILYSVTMFIHQLIYCLGDMMTAVSYYSFEEERTGQGLSMKIDEIGKAEDNPNYN